MFRRPPAAGPCVGAMVPIVGTCGEPAGPAGGGPLEPPPLLHPNAAHSAIDTAGVFPKRSINT